jgi:hypothetical protein
MLFQPNLLFLRDFIFVLYFELTGIHGRLKECLPRKYSLGSELMLSQGYTHRSLNAKFLY